ncbi:CD83 antigen [Meleagris gallopavo]|uniref:CD83 molecule n=1 Tax=Meleagris gallopavo TaxID=9103 RepID=A0A803YSV9_MELGA|nr:CD83 antigen [Meleagris gallopavo]
MASAAYTLLITLCNVWSLINGAAVAVPDVAVTCSEEVLLPCKVLQDSSITYQAVSWYKMAGVGDRIAWKFLDVESHYPKGLGGSLELSNNTFQLRIQNATSQDSGTYKCTLGEQRGDRNLSGIITLKVTGCPGIEDEKLKKYKTELFMLTCLGIFYLLLIFFTCTCLRKESMSPSDKSRRDSKHSLTLMSTREMTTFRVLNSDSTCKSGLTSNSI